VIIIYSEEEKDNSIEEERNDYKYKLIFVLIHILVIIIWIPFAAPVMFSIFLNYEGASMLFLLFFALFFLTKEFYSKKQMKRLIIALISTAALSTLFIIILILNTRFYIGDFNYFLLIPNTIAFYCAYFYLTSSIHDMLQKQEDEEKMDLKSIKLRYKSILKKFHKEYSILLLIGSISVIITFIFTHFSSNILYFMSSTIFLIIFCIIIYVGLLLLIIFKFSNAKRQELKATMEKDLTNEDYQVRLKVAQAKNIPLHILRKLSMDENKLVQLELLKRKFLTPIALLNLAKSKEVHVRKLVAERENLPLRAGNVLKNDVNEEIQEIMRKKKLFEDRFFNK